MILRHPLLRRNVTECLVLKVFVSSHTHFLPYFLRKRKYFFRNLFSRAVSRWKLTLPRCRRHARSEAKRQKKPFFRSLFSRAAKLKMNNSTLPKACAYLSGAQ